MSSRLLVMSMHRYFAGVRPERDTPLHDELLVEGRARVGEIRKAIAAQVEIDVTWDDETTDIDSFDYAPHDLHAIRSLAAHEEYPTRTLWFRRSFRLLPDPRDHRGLRRIYAGANTDFPHMMRHSDDRGFFLPVPFERPVPSNEAAWWMIGSTAGLLQELERIRPLAEREGVELSACWDRLQAAVTCANRRTLPLILEA